MGDYFKDRAIELAWNLVTKEFGLPKDKLTATVYIDDDEAFDLWKKIAGLPEVAHHPHRRFGQFLAGRRYRPRRSLLGNSSTTTARSAGPPGSPEQDGYCFVEYLEFRVHAVRAARRRRSNSCPPRKPSIDTVGLERVAAVLQGTHDNYDIDLFVALIRAISELTGADPQGPQKASLRVIADHLRASSFLISDGVLPSNEGRGYVLRRIMRGHAPCAAFGRARAAPMHRLVWAPARLMGQPYPELGVPEKLIEETLRLEEARFRKTLERGLSILDEKRARA